jgi:hypothetical protein
MKRRSFAEPVQHIRFGALTGVETRSPGYVSCLPAPRLPQSHQLNTPMLAGESLSNLDSRSVIDFRSY